MNGRNRFWDLLAAGAVVVLGLASRHYATSLPAFLAAYAGDTLWGLMVFVLVGIIAPRRSSQRVAGIALAFSYAVEISQLYHAPWIDAVRHTRLGGLVLGFGFLWSDLGCYTAGVALGIMIETGIAHTMVWFRRAMPLAEEPVGVIDGPSAIS